MHQMRIRLTLRFANTLSTVLGDIENGYKLGRMALLLLQGLDTTESLPRVRYRFYGTFALWKEPLQAIKESLREIAQESLAAGENEEAVLSTFTRCRVSFFSGDKLESVALDCAYATSTMVSTSLLLISLLQHHLLTHTHSLPSWVAGETSASERCSSDRIASAVCSAIDGQRQRPARKLQADISNTE